MTSPRRPPSGPYADGIEAYIAAGWSAMPLPARRKAHPPTGYTGAKGKYPDTYQMRRWAAEQPRGNIAVRAPPGVVGLDVDTYPHPDSGLTRDQVLDNLRKAVARYDLKVPDTFRSSARPDLDIPHTDSRAGIYWFRTNADTARLPSVLCEGVEFIRPEHRYGVVAPSVHPNGQPYRWYGLDGEPMTSPPSPDGLPYIRGLSAVYAAANPTVDDAVAAYLRDNSIEDAAGVGKFKYERDGRRYFEHPASKNQGDAVVITPSGRAMFHSTSAAAAVGVPPVDGSMSPSYDSLDLAVAARHGGLPADITRARVEVLKSEGYLSRPARKAAQAGGTQPPPDLKPRREITGITVELGSQAVRVHLDGSDEPYPATFPLTPHNTAGMEERWLRRNWHLNGHSEQILGRLRLPDADNPDLADAPVWGWDEICGDLPDRHPHIHEVDGWFLPADSIILISARDGTGKSWVAQRLLYGFPGRVVWFAPETGWIQRFRVWVKRSQSPVPDLRVAVSVGSFYQELADHHPEIVVVDGWAWLCHEENSKAAVDDIIRRVVRPGRTVIIVHHEGYPQEGQDPHPRGSSRLRDLAHLSIRPYINPDSGHIVAALDLKNRHGLQPRGFRSEIIIEEDGYPAPARPVPNQKQDTDIGKIIEWMGNHLSELPVSERRLREAGLGAKAIREALDLGGSAGCFASETVNGETRWTLSRTETAALAPTHLPY